MQSYLNKFYKLLANSVLLALVFFGMPGPGHARDIILDPGHSPAQPGAISSTGHKEYQYNDMLLKSVQKYLASRNLRVDVTRTPSEDISLQKRAEKSVGKKLFISLHHDSVQPQFMQKTNALPTSQKARGYSIFVSRKNPHFDKSLEYAKVLGAALRAQGMKPSTHHGEKIKGENRLLLDSKLGIYAHDDLIVLKQSKSPALLLESAVIVHPQDEFLARTEKHQLAIARALEKTIRRALAQKMNKPKTTIAGQ